MSYLAEPVRPAAKPHAPAAVVVRTLRVPLVLVVEEETRMSRALDGLCGFLRIAIETIGGRDDLARSLRERRPMAVIAEMDGPSQDGGYVMMRIAEHDRTLPLMLLTGHSPALLGAAEAVEEMCALSGVSRYPVLPDIGEIVEFLFRAGQAGRCLGLMPA